MKTIITVFGSTGDLTYKKLLLAFYLLIKKDLLNKNLEILCVGRRDYTTETYIEEAKKHTPKKLEWGVLEPYVKYIKLDIKEPKSYFHLHDYIKKNGHPLDVIFYLAVPPNLFPTIAKGINKAKLVEMGDKNRRLVFEKPFGEDLKSAHKINEELWQYFDESQIYRIDHYLGKEMIQNILVIRFANMIFQSSWDHHSIESVQIIAKEKEGIGSRGNYYDQIGALKDMVQNHLIQMVALIAMEEPETFDEKGIREEKVRLLKKLIINPEDVLLGQYDGYLKEPKVPKDSKTETFVAFKATINDSRWKNVPFYFMTGKKLDEKRSEIIVTFNSNSHAEKLWPQRNLNRNQLIIRVAPDEGIYFEMNVKAAGLTDEIKAIPLDYCHSCQVPDGNVPEAYEKLLLEIVKKNPTLFARWDEIETSWQIIDTIKETLPEPVIYKDYAALKKLLQEKYKEGNK